MSMNERLLDGAPAAPEPEEPVEMSRKGKQLLMVMGLLASLGLVVGVLVATESHGNDNSGGPIRSGSTSGFQPPSNTSRVSARRPYFPAHTVLSSLPKPSGEATNGMISNSYMFHYEENDSITHLEYNVTRKQHVYSLDMDHTVMSLECTANSLTVTTNTTASEVHGFATGHIVTIRGEWGCQGGSQMREILGIESVNGHDITFKTRKVPLSHAFQHARIRYRSNAPTEKHVVVTENVQITDDCTNSACPGRRRGVESWLEGVWSDIKDAGEAVYDLGKLAVTGNLDVQDDPLSSSWTLGPKPCLNGAINGASTECKASFDVTTDLEIDITDYSLQNFKFTITGDANLMTEGSFTLTEPFSYKKQWRVLNDRVWTGVIPIGEVTIPVSIVALMYLGLNVDASLSLTVGGSIGVSGQATYGYQYYPGIADSDKYIHQQSFSPSHSLDITAKAEATVQFNIMPVLLLEAAFIGGPTVQVSVTPTLDIQADAGLDGDNGDYETCASASADASVELGLGFGADIDLEIGGDTIYQKQYNLVSIPVDDLSIGSLQFGDQNC